MFAITAAADFLPILCRPARVPWALLASFLCLIGGTGCLGLVHPAPQADRDWAELTAGLDQPADRGPEEVALVVVDRPKPPVARKVSIDPPEAPQIAAAEKLLATQVAQTSAGALRPTQVTSHGWHCGSEPPIYLCLHHNGPRWRHRGLDQLLEEHPDPAAILTAGSHSDDPEIAATAVIGLARLAVGEPSADLVKRLAAVCQDAKLTATTRAAAWETLGNLETAEAEKAVASHWDQVPAATVQAEAPKIDQEPNWETRERWIAWAKRHSPRKQAAAETAFTTGPAPLKALLLDLMFISDGDPLPSWAVEGLSGESRGTLRKQGLYLPYLRTAAPLDELTAALRSPEFPVREAALLGLGREGSPEAKALLESIDDEAPTLIRVAAVNAWGVAGDQAKVRSLAEAKSHRVRLAAARWIEVPEGPSQSETVIRLLADPQRDVHQAMLDRVRTWPQQIGRPLIQEAAARTPAISGKRTEDFRQILGNSAEDTLEPEDTADADEGSTLQSEAAAVIDPQRALEILGWIDQLETSPDPQQAEDAKARLIAAGAAVPQVLKQYAEPLAELRPERLEREVLPQIEPIFQWTSQLSVPPDAATAEGLRKLRQRAERRPLPGLAMWQLRDFAEQTDDAGVWRDLVQIISHDPSAASMEIAKLGLSHNSPHIRRQACRYFQPNYDPSYRATLENLLADEVASVRQAAVEALAQEDDPELFPQLIQLLADTDPDVRLAAAVSLARRDQAAGDDALRRMTHSRSESQRLKVARAYAELARPRHLPILVQLLDDSTSVRSIALEALPKLVDDEELRANLQKTRSTHGQVALWKAWHRPTPLAGSRLDE